MKTLVIALTFLFSCFAVAQDDRASSVAREWLEIVDAENYFQSYQLTDDAFKDVLTAPQWEDALNNIRLPFGSVVWRSEIKHKKLDSIPGWPSGEYITIEFNTKLELSNAIIETVTLSRNSGEWRPIGYFIKL